MDIGIGLPNTVIGTDGPALCTWAQGAEAAGFSTLGTIGRLAHSGYEELIALTAAAAATTRIRLTTSVLIAPLYTNTALLAKQAASLDRISRGRLVLGMALGGRGDDYTVSGLGTERRGRRFDQQLDEMKRIWSEPDPVHRIGPETVGEEGPELIIGGASEAAFQRVARIGDGWIMGGGSPDQFAQAAGAVDAAWQAAGREGVPRKLALTYFALGPDAREHADTYLRGYYAFLGEAAANAVAQSASITPHMVQETANAFEAQGCDELIFIPTTSAQPQIDLLAQAVADA
ncbi:LLM class flavin-dependent oxidoreductase [Actinocorallia aurea]